MGTAQSTLYAVLGRRRLMRAAWASHTPLNPVWKLMRGKGMMPLRAGMALRGIQGEHRVECGGGQDDKPTAPSYSESRDPHSLGQVLPTQANVQHLGTHVQCCTFWIMGAGGCVWRKRTRWHPR